MSKPVVTKADVIGPFDPSKALTLAPSSAPVTFCRWCLKKRPRNSDECRDCQRKALLNGRDEVTGRPLRKRGEWPS